MGVAYEYVHVQNLPMLFCVDDLITVLLQKCPQRCSLTYVSLSGKETCVKCDTFRETVTISASAVIVLVLL